MLFSDWDTVKSGSFMSLLDSTIPEASLCFENRLYKLAAFEKRLFLLTIFEPLST